MALWRNKGAPFDGPTEKIVRDEVFEADAADLVVRMRRRKLERLPDDWQGDSLEDYATGGGWYEFPDGRKVQGREKAMAVFDEITTSNEGD